MIIDLKKLSATIVCMLLVGASYSQPNTSALMPLPNHIEQIAEEKPFRITTSMAIKTNLSHDAFCLSELRNIIKERCGIELNPNNKASKGKTIELLVDKSIIGKDRYILDVSEHKLTIKGADQGAIFYGVKTLDQILLGDLCNTAKQQIAPIRIDDSPRYGHRALMLDPARHFIPVEDVKFFIDQMARYKYNILQLHLTDDQGWRIEIKKHPKLTQVGAFRNPKTGDNGPDNGFYTQDQLRNIIKYAEQRNIEIIPEVDIPGHTVAVLAVYPELGCTHTDSLKKVIGETVDMMLCSNNEKVYQVYDDIIGEIASIFPSSKIHLGGDEAVLSKSWKQCDKCQSLKKDLAYTKEAELMNYFFGKILTSVRKYGKEPLLWCELDNIRMPASQYLFDYPQDVTLITWRAGLTPKCIELTAKSKHKLIMAPGEYAYLDYPQFHGDFPEFNNWGMPTTTLRTCYQFDPGYGLEKDQQEHIIGITGTLWAEAMKNINRVTYMTYPRAFALSEAAWTQMEHRQWESFKQRMYPNLMNLIKHGVSVRAPFEIERSK